MVLSQRWRERALALRRSYRFSGADQLRWYLIRKYPLGPWPCARTIGRWIKAAGLARKRKRHAAPGPMITVAPLQVARGPNDVWTLDFKGWFCTADGQRVCALTVRDLATRYLLLVRHVARSNERAVAAIMRRLFRRRGVPNGIHVDNGPPFGGVGPRGWTMLAVGWIRLGISVSYSRPGCPQDNAAHEQMHQVLQEQTARPAAATLAAQQRRFDHWRWKYNSDRPNQALGMRLPCALYRPSERRPTLRQWEYPSPWLQKRTDPRGRIHWANRQRIIGRAFGRQLVALKPLRTGVVAVYFGPYLLGELHASDPGPIRPVQVRSVTRRPQKPLRSSC
jgi:transposase InsO family protein